MMEIASVLRSRGKRVTAQRLAVMNAVAASREHPSAEEVHSAVRRQMPQISLATVYKALSELREAGQLRVVPVSGKLRYDAVNGAAHHHLICEDCKRVVDVRTPPGFRAPRLTDDSCKGFEVMETELTFRGLCPECRHGAAGTTSRKRARA